MASSQRLSSPGRTSSSTGAPPAAYVLFDSGPLLAFGAAKGGPTLLKVRYAGRAGAVTDVFKELAGLSRNTDPYLAAAATAARACSTWLEHHVVDDEADLALAATYQDELRAYKRHPDRDRAGGRKDWGECVTVVVAERLTRAGVVVVAANDDAARALAAHHGIPTATAADLLQGAVRDGQLTPGQAFDMTRQMTAANCDVGDAIRDASYFRTPPRESLPPA